MTTPAEELNPFTMAHDFAKRTILSRYAYDISEDDYGAAIAYEEALGASLAYYVSLNSGAQDVQVMSGWTKNEQDEDIKVATISFDLVGGRNNHVGRSNVAHHLIAYLNLARAHEAMQAETPL